MTDFEIFPDAEQLAIEILKAANFGAFAPHVDSDVPSNFSQPGGPDQVITVHRYGGVPVERHRLDSPRLQFDTYAQTKADAHDIAVIARVRMMQAEGKSFTVPPCFLAGVEDDLALFRDTDPQNFKPRYIFALQLTVHA